MRALYKIPLVFITVLVLSGWGFYGHQCIVEWSVYTLPDSLFIFYTPFKEELKSYSVLPDVLKNSQPKEYCRHYIDLEHYDSLVHLDFPIDSCSKIEPCYDRGILPFIILDEFNKLITAFSNKNVESILRLSGGLSHYCSDLCVPLHTTENYNGQLTGQKGVHALWESYLLENYSRELNLYGIYAKFEPDIQGRLLKELYRAHQLVFPLLESHRECLDELKDKAYGFYKRKGILKKGYSMEFQSCFYKKVDKQLEEQLRHSIQLTSDLWFSAWVLAKKPQLNHLVTPVFIQKLEENTLHSTQKFDKRKHETP